METYHKFYPTAGTLDSLDRYAKKNDKLVRICCNCGLYMGMKDGNGVKLQGNLTHGQCPECCEETLNEWKEWIAAGRPKPETATKG